MPDPDIREVLLSSEEKIVKREDRFCIVGEDDGQGNIVLYKHYLYNPKRKSKPIKIPVKDFWGTAESFENGVYRAKFLPKKKKLSLKEETKKLKHFSKYLKKPKKVTCAKKTLVKGSAKLKKAVKTK